jgi:hypothetical protein
MRRILILACCLIYTPAIAQNWGDPQHPYPAPPPQYTPRPVQPTQETPPGEFLAIIGLTVLGAVLLSGGLEETNKRKAGEKPVSKYKPVPHEHDFDGDPTWFFGHEGD